MGAENLSPKRENRLDSSEIIASFMVKLHSMTVHLMKEPWKMAIKQEKGSLLPKMVQGFKDISEKISYKVLDRSGQVTAPYIMVNLETVVIMEKVISNKSKEEALHLTTKVISNRDNSMGMEG